MKDLFFLFFLIFFSFSSYSQKEANKWYFGENAGIDFISGIPVVLTNGALNTFEGCASISDYNGNLLFYTDGETVWNANHLVMDNGTGLEGYRSSAQSSLIVPFPCDSNKYYIFTTDGSTRDLLTGRENFPNDSIFAYSIVDMNFNGGLGKVVQKNVVLFTPVDEKVTGVKHFNEVDTWVISHKVRSNSFYAYLITSSGIQTPVISSVGPIQQTYSSGSHLKISPDGKRLAQKIDNMDVFDFNNSTGIVSNHISLGPGGYGFSFSPDGNILYVFKNGSTLEQYNLLAGTTSQIINSQVVLCGGPPSYNCARHAMQNAPDGKIYIAWDNSTVLSVINNPNILGVGCNYLDNGFSLGGKKSRYGLPNFIESYFSPAYISPDHICCSISGINFGNDTLLCPESTLSLNAYFQNATYEWQDGSIGSDFVVNKPGNYWVDVKLDNCVERFSVNVNYHDRCCSISGINFGKDTLLCPESTLTLNAYFQNATYEWQDGSIGSDFVVNKPGNYWVDVKLDNCVERFSINVNYHDCIQIIPNLLTVNNDGFNELFEIKGMISTDWRLEVYNRWGKSIYKNETYLNDWYPENVSDGIYYYVFMNKFSGTIINGWLHVTR